jgi:diacylglycerol O-acyltransferase / wax synthase
MTAIAEHRRDTHGPRRVSVARVPVPDLCCLWAETETTPMNIALVGTIETGGLLDDHGEVDLPTIRAFVEAHLDRAPMLRKVLKPTRPGQGRPVWTDARDFTIERHILLAEPGRTFADDQDFLDWCARETVRPLDRSRPLWRISIVPGLSGQRLGLLVVVHHVVADGLRGVAMIAGLLDVDPAGRTTSAAPWRPAPAPTPAELVVDNLRAGANAVRSIRPDRLRRRLVGLRGLREEISSSAPATVLTGVIGQGRQLVVIGQPLEDLRAAAHALGCTINDLLLAAVTHGLRQMLCSSEDCGEAMKLRATVPVGETNGHAGGMIAVSLPIGFSDPTDRLRHIVAETSRRKQSPDGGIAGIVSMPANLAHLGVVWARHAGATHINLYVTNVPGPLFPLYLAGARLHDVVPLAPLVAGVRLSVTALSYNGVLSVALLADQTLTDFPALTAGVRAGFDTYLGRAGLAETVIPTTAAAD